ncbi:MAG TPA: phospho-N-acetylmuramoyl-pentapeptide-transferase [Opitutales bacterium]|jgi:phospho-N-acetylmuramoyl-pentapeptide-transferase|nr:phospho-N-acetylmuramoyl-pentapeptide-transferase [Opitutales bacterium]
MLTWLADYEKYWGPLRLFRYETFRGLGGAATALLLGFIFAPWMFAKLRALKANQAFRKADELGKLTEKHNSKQGTPTMGGILIYAVVTLSVLLWARLNLYVWVCLLVFTGLGAIGFADDYLKVTKKNSKGLSSKWKLAGQAALTLAAVGLLFFVNPETHHAMSELRAPFFKAPLMAEMPIWFIAPFFFLVMAGSSNAINLTDGMDGLAIGCTITVALVYAIFAYCAGNIRIADYLNITYVPGVGELAVVCAALVGGGLAFLWHNALPATVFMGDTGSLALGGIIGSVAFMTQQPFTLIIVGGIFVMEAGSVLLQVASYKLRGGKRIFLMSPLHHHFELLGWPESKLVVRFWILSVLFALAGLGTLKLR